MKDCFFQQLFEQETSTYTYLLADMDTKAALIIDPVLETADRDLQLIRDLELNLLYVLETHVHADHVTGAGRLADATSAKIVYGKGAKTECPDLFLGDGETLQFGNYRIKAISCPGHTDSCTSYLCGNRLFSGDTLMIKGNGRTDLQGGSAERLYGSIHEKLFVLPDDTLVYPAHDYKGFTSSTIGIEKRLSPRLGAGRSLGEFVETMRNLKLPYPKNIDTAVPANLKCGRT